MAGVREASSVIEGSIVYTDEKGIKVDEIIISKPDSTAFSSAVYNLLNNSPVNNKMKGTPNHYSKDDKFSTTLMCHDSNSETYKVTINPDNITISEYLDDSILVKVKTWADAQSLHC